MKDTYKHKGLRKKLVEELLHKGISDEKVLQAILHVPRHFFFTGDFEDFAYEDKAYPIGEGQTISQPYTVASQSTLLQVEKGMKVLEIGTGSGYQAAVLCELGAKLYSIERKKPLLDKANRILNLLGYSPELHYTDGTLGLNSKAPFDRIIVTAGAPKIPGIYMSQLAIGGKLVIPVGNEETQRMLRVTKLSETEWKEEDFGEFRFVPLIGADGW